VAIIGGLSTSTIFTLIFLPTFYSISDSVTVTVKKWFGFDTSKV
jgi:Cu/Ag efflux pump CusA